MLRQSLDILRELALCRRPDESKGFQTFISCLIKQDRDLDMTLYIVGEVFHPNRRAKPTAQRWAAICGTLGLTS